LGRRSRNTHFDSGKRVENRGFGTPGKDDRIALCGEDYFMANYSPNFHQVNCGKCASILTQRWIDAWNANPENKKLELERVVDPKAHSKGSYAGYRYAYKALYGGEHVGYVVMDGGYGSTHWLLRAIGLTEETDAEKPGSMISNADIKKLAGQKPSSYEYNAHEFDCKERALLRVPELVKVKTLRTHAQTIQDRDEMHERYDRRQAEQAAEDAAEEAERLAALEGLKEIRGVNSLSDEARSGLEYAIKLVEKKSEDR